jgi:hypothetical protein
MNEPGLPRPAGPDAGFDSTVTLTSGNQMSGQVAD